MRSSTATLWLLLLGLFMVTVKAQTKKTDVVAAFNNNGHKLAASVLDIAGVTGAASDPKARFTFFMPTDAAIQTFLKDMGLTVDDLKKRPVLAKQLVGQHTILGSNVREKEIFEKGETRRAASLASALLRGDQDLEFKRSNGKFTVTDPQGNVANVVGKPIHPDDNKTIIPIDRVLMGDEYYTNFETACKLRKGRVSDFCKLLKSTGLDSSVKPSTDATLFVPNNDAFAKATASSKPSSEQLARILKYHVVPGARELPGQWNEGASYSTLLDNLPLKMTYERKSHPKRLIDFAEASVSGADGKKVPILKPNVHIGKTVIHGIGSVLNPSAALTKPAATSTEKGAAQKTGRKLLGYGWTTQYAPTANQDAASAAIAAAVAGDSTAATAASQSLTGAQALSVPGAYDAIMNGVDPW